MNKEKTLDKEKAGFIAGALSWMYEMELVDTTPVLNNLYGNIYSSSKQIKDVELLIDKNSRKILVYLDLKPLGRLYSKKIGNKISNGVLELLPKYKVRVIFDKILFDKAYKVLMSQIGSYQEVK